MNIEPGQVYTFKFTSGEEIIAKVTAVQDHEVAVSEPVAVAPGPQGMGLIPALFTADHDHKIWINMNNCIFVACTESAVTAKYIQATTGLEVPQKKIVLG